jgi:hypothetical protein
MSTNEQINANRENAQKSTGPTTEAGKLKSSLNATKHGFTGLTLQLTAPEIEPYNRFVAKMTAELRPHTEESRELLQTYINLRWSLNQLLVQQTNLLSVIDQINSQFLATGDITGLEAALEAPYRRLRTLGTYEQRRLRAAKDVLDRFTQLEKEYAARLKQAADNHRALKKLNQNWNPAEFGFVCSLPEIEQHIRVQDFAESVKNGRPLAKSA